MGYKSWQKAKKIRVGDYTAKSIFLYLAECRNELEGVCNPSQERIADETEINIRTVKRKLKYLDDKNFISRNPITIGKKVIDTFYELSFKTASKSMVSERHDREEVNSVRATPQQENNGVRESKSMVSERHLPHSPYKDKQETKKQEVLKEREHTPKIEERDGNNSGSSGSKLKTKKGSRIPMDFAVSDSTREWAKKNAPDIDVDEMTIEFKLFW